MYPQVKTSLFTKTYQKDYGWLRLLGRTIDKFASGFESWYVVTNEGEPLPDLDLKNIEVVYAQSKCPNYQDAPCPFAGMPGLDTVGYNFQQVVKMRWIDYVPSHIDSVVQIDSDCILLHSMNPDTIRCGGHPYWLTQPLEGEFNTQGDETWGDCMTDFFGERPKLYYMNESAYTITREACEQFNLWVERTHNMTFEDYCMSHECSEYNFLGGFLDMHMSCGYIMINYEQLQNKWLKIRKFWSWSDEELKEAEAFAKEELGC